MDPKRRQYLAAREMDLNRREFLASLTLALAGCTVNAQEAPDETEPEPGAPGGSGGSSAGSGGPPLSAPEAGAQGGGEPGTGQVDAGVGGPRRDDTRLIERIAFGSCNWLRPSGPDRVLNNQGFWDLIAAHDPHAFMPLGDNIYIDLGDRYSDLAGLKGFQNLMAHAVPMPIWDDHDYGLNDAGMDWAHKETLKQMFNDFWAMYGGVPADSARWKRPGNYDSAIVGPPGKEVQFLMLDDRSFRVPAGAMLGEQQWTWLEGELKKPARIRIVESGSAVFASASSSESWAGHPAEFQRLVTLINDTKATGVVAVSGDKHYSDVSRRDGLAAYPLYDFMSSGLTQGGPAGSGGGGGNNSYRDTPTSGVGECCYALLAVDWSAMDPALKLEYRSAFSDKVLMTKTLTLSALGEK